ETRRLAVTHTWAVALGASVAAWLLPGLGFWRLATVWGEPLGLVRAEHAYAVSSSLGGLVLAPGGVLIAGNALLDRLVSAGLSIDLATLSVFGTRLATLGVATALGIIFSIVHLRTAPAASATHFDDIADAYDVQIPESRREALLKKKTELMRDVLAASGAGRRGLDVGCGQGAYVGRMRELGFDVSGIDVSSGQIALAARKLGVDGVVARGSVLEIPAPDGSYDFLYIINVLHHLSSVEEQRRGFAELLRVLKPGGLLFVHEINTRNTLFRFYMGYVFPSLNCIDEGVERWLRADRLSEYTEASVVDVRYFTFLPDFVPQFIARMLAPLERALEQSPAGAYSAHYMAVLQKGAAPDGKSGAPGHRV
ncbi:MAG: methyltransferase domain-containing protein, partial [Vicinamibacterales bacterium]